VQRERGIGKRDADGSPVSIFCPPECPPRQARHDGIGPGEDITRQVDLVRPRRREASRLPDRTGEKALAPVHIAAGRELVTRAAQARGRRRDAQDPGAGIGFDACIAASRAEERLDAEDATEIEARRDLPRHVGYPAGVRDDNTFDNLLR
jgi:hypothetical protein